jgi:hypothetical protein
LKARRVNLHPGKKQTSNLKYRLEMDGDRRACQTARPERIGKQ